MTKKSIAAPNNGKKTGTSNGKVKPEIEDEQTNTSKDESISTEDTAADVAKADTAKKDGELYTVFISGIDNRGRIVAKSHSDVNIIAVANTGTFHFNKSGNEVNGEQALVFARERYAFEEGDCQRGRNQMTVIQGVVNKALSPEILKNYSSLLFSLQESFETNISYEEIARLLQQQLKEGGAWNVVTYSTNGTGATKKPYSMSQNAYVMEPDYTTVEKAKELMQKVYDAEIISQEDLTAENISIENNSAAEESGSLWVWNKIL